VISGKQKRYLRGLGHHLQPVVQVGKGQVTEGLVSALGAALHDHELIKVKLGETVEGDRNEIGSELATAAEAELVQVLGRTVLLYKRREKDPEIVLPKG
jgi:RNA-binding protein